MIFSLFFSNHSNHLGIVQLEIRRARVADSGTYTCVAANDLGEDTVSCEVLVREVIPPSSTKA